MVVDTSALIAVFVQEPDWQVISDTIRSSATPPVFSAASYLEARIVIDRRGRPDQAVLRFEALLGSLGVRIAPVDEAQARIAADAYARYGKGRHPAALNFGDCFSYALAKHLGQPLLFKGDDFAQTDIAVALPV